MASNPCLLVLAALAFGCASRPAQLTGRWVYLAGGNGIAVGPADVPEGGAPLRLTPGSAAAGGCMPVEEVDSAFGPSCANVAEQASPGAAALVRWYCRDDLTVRVRFERCPQQGRVRPVEIAVATLPAARPTP